MALNHILLPFDGSSPSSAALSHVRLLGGADVRVTLVYVLPPTQLMAEMGAGQGAARDAQEMLEGAARELGGDTTCTLLAGDPAEAIAAEAARLGVDLIVFGSRGRSPLAGLLLGSTARRLLAVAPCPVLVTHEPVTRIHAVIVGVEEGGTAGDLARTASAIAERTGAAVHLVNVVDADPDLVASPARFGIPADVWREAVAQHAERVFGPLRPIVPGATEVTRYGPPAAQLREVAERHAAELVVVGRQGRSGRAVEAWFSVAFNLAVRGPHATLVR